MQTTRSTARARAAYLQALELREAERLDGLAVDALHMLAFVDTAPADQLKWGREALAVALASSNRRRASGRLRLRNNVGYALHQLGQYDAALAEFQRAVVLREAGGNAEATRTARWMVAWTLRALKAERTRSLEIAVAAGARMRAADEPDTYVFEELEFALPRARRNGAGRCRCGAAQGTSELKGAAGPTGPSCPSAR